MLYQKASILRQHKKGGGIRIARLTIGRYDKDWNKLFQPLIAGFKKFKRKFLLTTDGDTGALKTLKGKVKILFQRCLWHIPYQMKFYLWKDNVKRKSKDWYYCLSALFKIYAIREHVDDDKLIDSMVELKEID